MITPPMAKRKENFAPLATNTEKNERLMEEKKKRIEEQLRRKYQEKL